ncbi:MAG: hypothetical protein WCS85_01470 [Candidatus Peribacteraceae bacterium]
MPPGSTREIPEEVRVNDRWNQAKESLKKYMDTNRKAVELLDALPNGARRQKLFEQYTAFREQGNVLMDTIANQQADILAQVKLKEVMQQFEEEMDRDTRMSKAMLTGYQSRTLMRCTAFQAAYAWAKGLTDSEKALHKDMVTRKVTSEGELLMLTLNSELSYLQNNFGETQKSRIAFLLQWKTFAASGVYEASGSIRSTENYILTSKGEREYFTRFFSPDELVPGREPDTVGKRLLDDNKTITVLTNNMLSKQSGLVGKIMSTTVPYAPTIQEARIDFDELQALAQFWKREDPSKVGEHIRALRPSYTKVSQRLNKQPVLAAKENRTERRSREQSTKEIDWTKTDEHIALAKEDPTKENVEAAIAAISKERNFLLKESELRPGGVNRINNLGNALKEWNTFLSIHNRFTAAMSGFRDIMEQGVSTPEMVQKLRSYIQEINIELPKYVLVQTNASGVVTQFETLMNEQFESKGYGVRLKFDGTNNIEWVLSEKKLEEIRNAHDAFLKVLRDNNNSEKLNALSVLNSAIAYRRNNLQSLKPLAEEEQKYITQITAALQTTNPGAKFAVSDNGTEIVFVKAPPPSEPETIQTPAPNPPAPPPVTPSPSV